MDLKGKIADLKSTIDAQPRYVLFGAGLIALGVILIIVGIFLL